MDWFSWLSKTSLEPSLVREYALDFAHNELEEDDISHFNHEFLQSMGISVAKHRLEILKLARKEKRRGIHHISRLISMIKRTNKIFGNYIRKWVHHEDSALTVVPKCSYSSRWKAAMLKRNKTMIMGKQERMMIANVPLVVSSTCLDDNKYSSPMLYEFDNKEEIGDSYDDGYHRSSGYEEEMKVESYGDGHLSTGFEETRWVEMFKDLKPT